MGQEDRHKEIALSNSELVLWFSDCAHGYHSAWFIRGLPHSFSDFQKEDVIWMPKAFIKSVYFLKLLELRSEFIKFSGYNINMKKSFWNGKRNGGRSNHGILITARNSKKLFFDTQ